MTDATTPGAQSSNRGIMIVLSYLWLLALVPLLVEKEDKEVQWHAKHGIVLMVAEIVLWIAVTICDARHQFDQRRAGLRGEPADLRPLALASSSCTCCASSRASTVSVSSSRVSASTRAVSEPGSRTRLVGLLLVGLVAADLARPPIGSVGPRVRAGIHLYQHTLSPVMPAAGHPVPVHAHVQPLCRGGASHGTARSGDRGSA